LPQIRVASIARSIFHALPRSMQKPARKIVRSRRSKRRLAKARSISKVEMSDGLRRLGVRSGDIVFVHSSMSRLGSVVGGAEAVIGALLDVIGSTGTLVMPAFSQPYGSMISTLERNDIFDPATTPCTLGLIPETFRHYDGVLRSVHPTSSVCAYGEKAELITHGAREAGSDFGIGTPLHKVMEYGGKILGLGVSLGPVSFYHVIEDVMGADFPIGVKSERIFEARVIEAGVMHTMMVRPLDPLASRTRIDQPKSEWIRDVFTETLIDRGALSIGYVGEARSWLASAKEILEAQQDLLKRNVTIYTTESEYKASGGQPLSMFVRSYRSASSDVCHNYLEEQASQIAKDYSAKGFWDPDAGNWIRQLNWDGSDWSGRLPHDWKYAIELQEGATQYAIITRNSTLDDHLRRELQHIHSKVREDGLIEGIPDGYPYAPSEYEYGTALSAMALGYSYFAKKDPALGKMILHDVDRVSTYVADEFKPIFDDPYSVILRAAANAHSAYSSAGLTEQSERARDLVEACAQPFLSKQKGNGLFPFDDSEYVEETSVHAQLKVDIGLLLASESIRSEKLGLAAAKNFEWVTKNLLLPTGALKWNIHNKNDFFEIHQMLYLITHRYLVQQLSTHHNSQMHAIRAWKFLLDGNRSCVDTYVENKRRTAAFFSFRYVDAEGKVQQNNEQSFKGSYEIGYSLWALALNQDLSL
jgi:aminoglycoside 3-N-acetyltransferase